MSGRCWLLCQIVTGDQTGGVAVPGDFGGTGTHTYAEIGVFDDGGSVFGLVDICSRTVFAAGVATHEGFVANRANFAFWSELSYMLVQEL